MEKIILKDLLSAVNGVLVGGFSDLSVEITCIDRDNRDVHENSVFFAVVGERFDAHDFLGGLEDSKVSGFVISKELETYSSDKFYVKVDDTQKALGDLAKWYKSLFSIPFIAVTGSVGKTTAKDMIASVLSSKYTVHKTQGNFNNTIGLPLTIFDLNHSHEICVLEMGMDTAGEIGYMSEIVEPDVAVITNVGDAHIERLGSRDNILKAKCEVLPFIKDDGLLLINGDDDVLSSVGKLFSFTTFGVGKSEKLLYSGKNGKSDGVSEISFDIKTPNIKRRISVPSLGEHMVYPCLFAIAVAERFDLSENEIIEGISNFIPTKMRMNQVKLSNAVTILDDTYNANPQSMKAGISILSDHKGKKKVAILGDMFELGEFSKDLHREVGKYVAEKNIDVLVTVGEQAKYIAEATHEIGTCEVYVCEDKEKAIPILENLLTSDITLLVKASRGMAMEVLVSHMKEYVETKYG